MKKYIVVLNSDLNMRYWKAIQWADSLDSIRANPDYTAGESMSFPKTPSDRELEEKEVVE